MIAKTFFFATLSLFRFTRYLIIAFLVLGTVAQQLGLKDFGNRQEGTIYEPHGSEDLTLVGIHRNFQQFDSGASLHVRFFAPQLSAEARRSIFIAASERQDLKHYLMRSTASSSWRDNDWNVFENWPTKDVIDPLNINSTNIGVLAGYQMKHELPVYFPVDVYADTQQSQKRAYTFYFVTTQDLQALEVSVTDSIGKEVNIGKPSLKCAKALHPNCSLYAAGTTQAFDLDFSALPPAEYKVVLTGRIPGTTDTASLAVRLYAHS